MKKAKSNANLVSFPPGKGKGGHLVNVVSPYNNAALLPDCLRSVAAAHPGIPTTVYVVDAGSTDGTAEIVGRDFPGVRLRVAAENRGYAALNNLALKEIVAEIPQETDRTR